MIGWVRAISVCAALALGLVSAQAADKAFKRDDLADSAIRLEASLSFIGLGVPPPTATWGQMIREGTVYLSSLPLLSLAPGAALLMTVFAFNLVGDGLRDVLDPRSRG